MNGNRAVIPDEFRDKIIRSFKDDGRAFLDRLPGLLEEYVRKWGLTGLMPEKNLSYHYICYVHSPEYGELVLKAGVPHLELFTGIDALTLYGGENACRLYDADRDKGVMLLERLPGLRLGDEPDFRERMAAGWEK